MTTAEHLDRAEKCIDQAEHWRAQGKYDRAAAYAALTSAHIAMAQVKGASK